MTAVRGFGSRTAFLVPAMSLQNIIDLTFYANPEL